MNLIEEDFENGELEDEDTINPGNEAYDFEFELFGLEEANSEDVLN